MDLANILSSPQKVLHHSVQLPAMTSNKTTDQLQPDMRYLFDAIDSATEDRVRSLLRAVCQERQEAFDHIGERLLLRKGELKRATPWETDGTREEEDYEEYDSEDDLENNENEDSARQPDLGNIRDSDCSDEEDQAVLINQKRKGVFPRQRFEVCGQCHREYDVLQNGKKSCRWHTGSFIGSVPVLECADIDIQVTARWIGEADFGTTMRKRYMVPSTTKVPGSNTRRASDGRAVRSVTMVEAARWLRTVLTEQRGSEDSEQLNSATILTIAQPSSSLLNTSWSM